MAARSQMAGEDEAALDIDLDPHALTPRRDVPTVEQYPVPVSDPIRRPDVAVDPAPIPARPQDPPVTGSAPERLAAQPPRVQRDHGLPRTARRGAPTALPARDELVADHLVPELRRAGLLGAGGDDRVELAAPWPVEPFEIRGGAGRSEIHVHLGRVEVHRAAPPAPVDPAPAPRPTPSRPRPSVDHDSYLARRRADRGGERP